MEMSRQRAGKMLVILSSVLLVFTGWVLWGRVFSAQFPTALFSRSYLWFVQLPPVAMCIETAQQSALYTAVYNAAHASDGSLDPISDLIEILGVVSFALASINEISSTRSQGILLGDVINYYFPQHRIIMLWLHSCFFLLGWFSCYEHVGFVAALCLCGLVICFIYAFHMTWCFIIYPPERKRRVYNYLTDIMAMHNIGSSKTRAQCVMEYASYIGDLWNRTSYHSTLSEELFLVQTVYSWVQEVCPMIDTKQDKPSNSSFVGSKLRFQMGFLDLFGLRKNILEKDIPYCGEYFLFTQCLDFETNNARKVFQKRFITCSEVWENLFAQVQDSRRKSQMAYEILNLAKEYDNECFILFACGLIHQIGVLKFERKRENTVDSVIQRLDALRAVSRVSWEDISAWDSNNCDEFATICCEIIYIILGATLWGRAFGVLSEKDRVYIQDMARNSIISASLPDSLLYSLRTSCDVYSAYAFTLFTAANVNAYDGLSAYELCLRHNYVIEEMRFGLSP